jgi:TadE-like protein
VPPRLTRSHEHDPDAGSVTVEAVLLVPAMMLIFLVIIQFALWAHAAQVTQLAASDGDRVARSQFGGTTAGIAAAQSVAGPGLATTQVSANLLSGDVIRISVSGSAISIIPGLSFPVSAAQAGPIQEFRQSG